VVFVYFTFSAGGGVVALKSQSVRLVVIVLELVGERARVRPMIPKLLSMMQWSSMI